MVTVSDMTLKNMVLRLMLLVATILVIICNVVRTEQKNIGIVHHFIIGGAVQRPLLNKKQYFKRIKHQRKYGSRRITKKGREYLLILLLLAGDVELNPGPQNLFCDRCNRISKASSRLL